VWKTSQADDFSRPENPRFVEQLDLRATGFFLLAIMEAINAAPAISVGTRVRADYVLKPLHLVRAWALIQKGTSIETWGLSPMLLFGGGKSIDGSRSSRSRSKEQDKGNGDNDC
jgi:hypothetical protein